MEFIMEEKNRRDEIYAMYQAIFQDPESYAKYYFSYVYPKNRVLLGTKDQEILGMIHLNPYLLSVGSQSMELDYIVAVAVWEKYRRQGIMAAMLKEVFRMMYEERKPFTYLMPANRAYYEPFDFVFIMDWHEEEYPTPAQGRLEGHIDEANEEEYEAISQLMMECLKDRYKIYTVPTADYLKQQAEEIGSSGGQLMTWKKDGELLGTFTYEMDEDKIMVYSGYAKDPEEMKNEISRWCRGKALHFTCGNIAKGEAVPKIMGRITNVLAFQGLLRCKEGTNFLVHITDSWLEENQGTYRFQEYEGRLTLKIENNIDAKDTIGIGDLARVFFGYDEKEVVLAHPEMKNIQPLRPIHITEEV